MISICIPVYNYDVCSLVDDILIEIELITESAEIIIIDDASDEYFRQKNKLLSEKVHYIQLEQNIGRAAIRNKFLDYSIYEYLLFLDCDSLKMSKEFLLNYLIETKKSDYGVIYEGREYPIIRPNRNKLLRWKYGVNIENREVKDRRLLPNKSFMTNNFLIHKEVFRKTKFDERITEYGHEDTLFGFALKKEGINIHHIDNPILNGEIEDNYTYLRKVKVSIKNLINICEYVNYEKDFIKDIRLLQTYFRLKKINGIIGFVFVVLNPLMFWLLKKGYVNLNMFQFYKFRIHNPRIK